MEIANHRLDKFATILNDHQTMLQTVSHSVSQLNVDVHLLQAILASAIHNITRFVTALNDLDDIRIAIEGLAHGQLSPILLPPSLLTQTFFSIYDDIVNRSLDFNLKSHIHGDADIYRTHNFVTARRGSKLMIAFNFPLFRTFTCPAFTLYQIQSFPVPIPGESNLEQVSKITDLPYGIAFASYRSHFKYLLFDNKPQLHGNSFYLTHQNSQALRIFSKHHTCTSALLQNKRTRIRQLCHFHLYPKRLTPNIILLTPLSVLVTNISSLTFTCQGLSRTVQGCLQCQMTLPCGCSVHTSYGFIPTRLSTCHSGYSNITRYHTINLAVLQSFFKDERLGSLVGDTLLEDPLPVDIRTFDIFLFNDTSRLAKDSHLRYDLKRAINITKNEGQIFHSLAESLWHDTKLFDYPYQPPSYSIAWTDPTSLIHLIGLIIAILAFIGVILLTYRVKLLITTITALQLTVRRVAAANSHPTIPTFLSFFPPSNTSYVSLSHSLTSTDTGSSVITLDHLLFILCIILLVLFLRKQIRYYRSNPNFYHLYLVILPTQFR